jgi:two-component system, OmpR family, sensor kinase
MTGEDVILTRAGHDLRGELATMVTGVHYLLRYEAGLGEAGRQMLERIDGAGKRLGRLLDELELAVWIEGRSAITPGDAPRPPGDLVVEPYRLGPLVQGALRRLERSIAQRSVTVRADLPDDLPELEGDAELLGTAVEYVLDFAIARSPGRAVVASAGAAHPAELCVIDEGGPVDAAVRARLLEPFAEKEVIPRPEPGARRRERLGLGLAIARGIFAAHGGGLVVAPAPGGQGLALTCTLRR